MNPLSSIRKLVKQRDSTSSSMSTTPAAAARTQSDAAHSQNDNKPAMHNHAAVAVADNKQSPKAKQLEATFETEPPMEVKQVKVIIIGAGQRGQVYASYAQDFPDQLQVVGVAEPIKTRRTFMMNKYNIPETEVFDDWKKVATRDKFADAVIIATLDNLHKEPALAFAAKKYHILLEKPMAQTLEDCQAIAAAVEQNGVMLGIGHVLRYTPRYRKVKELIDRGVIGDVVSIQHLEPIGWFHFAHSYVRGNWRRQDESSFTLLTKSCHDIDLIHSLMQGRQCVSVSSFGSLSHFTAEHKPTNASDRCLTCEAETTCPYSAVKMYLDPIRASSPTFFTQVVCSGNDIEDMRLALKNGPYGRCVYECDNDVVSNQVVNMQYQDGGTVSFVMTAFSERLCQRRTTIFGTRGQICCDQGGPIIAFDFTSKRQDIHKYASPPQKTKMVGHGFADYFLMNAFVRAVASGDPSLIISNPAQSLESHRLVFAIEKARLENRVVHLQPT